MSTPLHNPYLRTYLHITQRRGRIFSFLARDAMVRRYAWAIPSGAVIWTIARTSPQIVEIGAGAGYWAWLLRQAGATVHAYDQDPPTHPEHRNIYVHDGARARVPWSPVQRGGPQDARQHPDAALLLCWPPYADAMAFDALSAYTGDTLWYVGEGAGGCTGDDSFFELLHRSWDVVSWHAIPQWGGIHDTVTHYRRRKPVSFSVSLLRELDLS